MKYSLLAALLLSLVSNTAFASKTHVNQHQKLNPDTQVQDRTESVAYKNAHAQPGNLSQDHTYEPGEFTKRGLEMGADWVATGDLRLGWVQYNYNNPPSQTNSKGQPVDRQNRDHFDSKGFYTVGKLAVITPSWHGISAKLMGAGVTDFGLNDSAYEGRTFVFNAADPKPYAIVQEAYIVSPEKPYFAF